MMMIHPPLTISESPHPTKDGLIRSLSESQVVKKKPESVRPKELSVNILDPDEDEEDTSSHYIHLVSRKERFHYVSQEDHGYSKPFNWRPDHPLSKPTKTLFIPRSPRLVKQPPLKHRPKEEEICVTDSEDEDNFLPGNYDHEKAVKFMNEPEHYVSFANPRFSLESNEDEESDEWDEEASITKEAWSPAQSRLFNKALKVLNADRLSRLTVQGVRNEPILRRLSADKSAKRFRYILSETQWETKLTRWLHETLLEHLPRHLLSAYLEVLQSLRIKVPTLIDKMISGKLPLDISSQLAKEGLQLLIKRPWDPVATCLGEHNIKKLPQSPLLILICKENWTQRSKHWAVMLSRLGKLVVLDYSSEDSKKMSVSSYLHHMITQTIAKVRELKRNHPERPVILLGWGSVASVACQIAAMEAVAVVVCLGFPVHTLDGPRGEADDPIMDLKGTSVLFLIGEDSLLCRPDDIEDMRERMKAETGLIVIGGADDALRVCKRKKTIEGVTQSMVDRCLIDEIREFAANVLRAPPRLHLSQLNDSKVDLVGSPYVPASPLVFGNSSGFGGGKSGRKANPRPRKKSDKPRKPKSLNKGMFNITVNTDSLSGLKQQSLHSSLKAISPSPSSGTSSPSLFRPQSVKITADDLLKSHKKLHGDKMNAFIELPLTPLNPSEALKHMTNSPSINFAPPNISASLSLTSTPTFGSVIHSSSSSPLPLTTRHIIQHPGIRTPGLKTISSIPQLVCPTGLSSAVKSVGSSNVLLLNQHLESPKLKGTTPITIKRPIVCSATVNTSSNVSPSETLKASSSIGSLTSGKKGEKLRILALPSSSTSSPKLTETIKLVSKYLPKSDFPKDKDRRNVAEILAGLSSLQPEPSKTTTIPPPTTIASTSSINNPAASNNNKFVKVIQTLGEPSRTTQISPTPSSTPSRARKQIFLTTTTSEMPPSSSSKEEPFSTVPLIDEDTLSSSPKIFEQDILEEDFDDIEYKPYAKKSKPGKARKVK